ncbi:MAG: 3-isopropylmalate dehydratase small subunit [Thaumarchaeota archaeon]|nr:3-isopropylmalate dehydratase small subunit [Nitrososphaerota archaeon]
MESFKKVKSTVTPFDRVNVDTDQIIPKQFLKLIHKIGFGKFLFFNWRYDKNEQPISNFVLNDKKYNNSKIFVTRDNFGCGSSREHAVWALKDYGFDVIIAPSFADIFYSNCFKNGMLAIKIESKIVNKLMNLTSEIEVDLENQTIKTKTETTSFQIDSYKKKILLEGLDDITLTFQYLDKIADFEKKTIIPSVL